MSKKNFSLTESEITSLFTIGSTFNFHGINYSVVEVGKPSPAKGECKADTYVLAQDLKSGKTKEFKVSIKQTNADFLENKISLERAQQILGPDAQDIIMRSTKKIKTSFENDFLVYFNSFGKTGAKTIKIGWKFEILNKKSGDKSAELILSQDQIRDIYSGINLGIEKRNSKVNGNKVVDSGVANYMLIADKRFNSIQDVMDSIITINDYIVDKKLYFACKAINYRAAATHKPKPWDGNRPLAVYVEWKLNESKLTGALKFENPLGMGADLIGIHIHEILKTLSIDKDNFNSLKTNLLDVNTYG